MTSLELIILAGVFLSTAALALVLFGSGETEEQKVKRRLNDLVKNRGSGQELVSAGLHDPADGGKDKNAWKDQIFSSLDNYIAGRAFGDGIRSKLTKADVKLQVSEFVAINVVLGVFLGLVGLLLGGIWFGITMVVVGLWVPWYYVGFLADRRLKLVAAQLPDALSIMSNALKSGYSLLQAMEVVSREMPKPISTEFGQVLKETRVNISVEDALINLTERVPSADLDLMATAMLIQRQVGGNLSEVLEKINETIRERIRILGEIRTLTAQGRISGLIVGTLPIFIGGVIQLISPGYLNPLFQSPVGWALLGMAVVMQAIGIIIIRSMIHLEV